ncbi:MAG TPA: Ig-like domain-containing protein [Candidatus Ozemobacteraceae bacterium]|nr:Ig-like domain-containing protein [Candidatus Ozemobacteraceae bacterium]
MKRILRPSVISARALLAGLIGMLTLFLYGCLGGGGGGGVGPGPEDRSLLIERVDQIVKALASGDGAALDQFRTSALGTDMPDGSRFRPLYVRDLGDSVTDPNDSNIYTFFYDPNEIRYLTADLAEVPLWTWFRDGNKFGLTLRLFKQEGYWYLDSLLLTSLDLTQAAATTGPVPSTALWPMAQDNRWQFVEIQAPPAASRRERPSSRVNAMILNATRVDFRTLSITEDPLPGPEGRQTFQFRMSTYEAGLATSQLDLPIDPGTFEFGRFSNGISAVDRGFITLPTGAIPGVPLWELLDPNHQGLIRAFEQSGLFLQGADTAFNGGRPWRLTDLLVQEGAAATQSITLTAPGIPPRTGEARILVMESLRVSFPWIQGLARRLDISLTWNGSPEVTWTSLFFLPGMGLVGYADYDLTTRRPVRFSWVWGASVGTRQFLPPGDSGSLDPFVTIAIAPVPPQQWTVGTPFTQQTAVSGGEPPFTWSLSGAPAWAAIDAGSGLLSGTPMQAGSFSFELSVRDAGDRISSMRVLADVATAAAPVVSGITPAEGFQGGSPIPVAITGQNFFGTPLVRLATATAVGPVATGLTLVDAGRLSGSLPVTGLATGIWSIEVINPDGQTATGTNLFRVRPAPASVPVTIDQAVAQADPAAAGPIHFTVVFARAVSGFTSADVSLGGTALPAACTVTPLPPNDGTAYDVAVSGMTGNGTVIASLPANIVIDIEGNENLPSASTDNQVVFDATAPAASVVRATGQTATTTADTANFTVTFTENVTGFTAAGVQITPPAGASPVAAVSAISSTTYTVTLSGMTADGPYAVTIAANAATDQAGTGNTAAPTPAIVTRDTLAPAATLDLAPGQSDPASLTPVLFRVTFTKPVVGFTAANIQVSDSAPFSLGAPDPTGLVYEIAVDMLGTGGIASVAIDPAGITDTLGNPLSGVTVIDDQVVFDHSMVYLTLDQSPTQPDPASSAPVLFTVTFNEPVVGFTPSDVSLGGTANPTTCTLTQLDALTWTIAVSGVSADGTVIASIPGGVMFDAVGNGNVPSSLNTIDNEVTLDTSIPSVVMTRAVDQVATSSGSVASFSVTFSEPVTGFTAADVITAFPVTPPTVTVAALSPTTYSVLLTMPDDGLYTATVPAGAAADSAGNGNTGPAAAAVTRDATGPGVSVALAPGQPALASASAATFTVTFDEPVTGFGDIAGDIIVTGPVGTVQTVTPVSVTTYTVSVTSMTADGPYAVTIAANAATDQAGTGNTAAPTPAIVTRDTLAPAATLDLAPGQSDPASLTPVLFRVTFTKPVVGFTAANIQVSDSAPFSLGAPDPTGLVYEIAVDMLGTGGIASVAIDPAGITDTLGNPLSGVTVIDDQVVFDHSMVYLTLDQSPTQPDPASSAPVLFTVTFNEPVVGFTPSDVSLGGTANPTTCTLTQLDALTWTIAVSGVSADGTVIASIPGGVMFDAVGNGNVPSSLNTIDNEVTLDTSIPSVVMTRAVDQVATSSGSVASFSVTFSEPVTGFTAADVITAFPVTPPTVTVAALSPTTYSVLLTMPDDGLYTATVPAGAAADSAGNGNTGPAAAAVTRDATGPGVSVALAPGQPALASASAATFTVTFDEPVTGFGDIAGDIIVTGPAGTVQTVTPVSVTTYTVTLSGMTADGIYQVTVPAGAASDTAGLANTAAAPAQVTRDATVPTALVALAPGQPALSNGSAATFTVTFSEAVTGFGDAAADFQMSGPGLTGTPVFVAVSPTTYTVTIDAISATGSYDVLIAADVVADQVGIGNSAGSFPGLYTLDTDSPGVSVALAPGQPALMNVDTASFTVTFSEGVTGFGDNLADITVSGPVVPGISVTAISPSTYTVVLTAMVEDGAYTVQIPAAVASDAAGNLNAGPSASVSVTRDTVAPLATISTEGSQSNPASTTPVFFGLTFSESIQGNWAANLSNTGTAGPVTWVSTTSDPDLRIFTIGATSITGQGTVLPALNPTGLTDQAGNPLTVDVTAASVTYDTQPPTVAKIGDGTTAVVLPITGTSLVFSEPVSAAGKSAIEAEIIQIVTGGMTVMPTVWSADSMTLTLNAGGSDPIGVLYDVKADVSDGLGNVATKLLLIDAPVDTTPPTVSTVLGNGVDPYQVSASLQSVLFSEPLSPESVTILRNALESAWGSTLNFGYVEGRKDFWFSGSTSGTFTSDITVTVTDIAGNAATLTIIDTGADATPPSVNSLDGPVNLTAPGTADLVFSEPLTTTGRTDVQNALNAAKSGTAALGFTWLGGTLRFGPTTGTASWTTDVSVPLLTDLAGNSAADLPLIIADTTPPTVSPLGTTGPYTVNQTVVDLAFSEPVDAASQLAVREAIAAIVGSPNMTSSWNANRTVFSFMVNTPVVITAPIYCDVTDLSGNTANLLLISAGPA